MWLKQIQVKGFRNLEDQSLEFDPTANYLFGDNATGKTSLLEAIHYLAIGRSFRKSQDREVLKFGAPVFIVQGEASTGETPPHSSVLNHREHGEHGEPGISDSDSSVTSVSSVVTGSERQAEIRSDGLQKRLVLDRVEVERLSSYLGWLPVVTMLLDDIRLIRGSPGERRAFLDLALSQVSRQYLISLVEYRRILAQRNRLLMQNPDSATLRTWDEQLVLGGTAIYQQRNRYLPALFKIAIESAQTLFAGWQTEITYRASVSQEGDVAANFHQALERHRLRERELGVTLAGPHRDDITILKNGIELRKFGSEGEQRSASIALKLAEAHLIQEQRKEAPVFLLDEIASELDAERSRELFALLASRGQVFYAAAKPIPAQGRIFHVTAGKIQKA